MRIVRTDEKNARRMDRRLPHRVVRPTLLLCPAARSQTSTDAPTVEQHPFL
jgi:hypothetical protein